MADGSNEDLAGLDLAQSDLVREDMGIRPLENPERAACSVPFTAQGYVIPYYNILGQAVPFYRVKLIDYHPDVKYKQPKNTSTHIYFPKRFWEIATKPDSSYVILTEGEKKASLATKLGYPCVALGGVDTWRNRIVELPGDSELSQNKDKIQAKLPDGARDIQEETTVLATGLQELIDFLTKTGKNLVIVYDSDLREGVKPPVQRAAASLAFELRFRGVAFNRIRQLVLPTHHVASGKVGLDDFLLREETRKIFPELLKVCLDQRSAFPRHPNIRDFINKRLNKSKISRKEAQAVGLAILSEIDSDGLRLRSSLEDQMYYFNLNTKKLVKAQFAAAHADGMATTGFEQYLYRSFGLSGADNGVNTWLAAQFTGEDPVDEVTPYRVFAKDAKSPDKVVFQISDSHYICVSGDESLPDLPGLEVYDNGENGIMFESGHVQALDLEKLLEHYGDQTQKPVEFWWYEVLQQVRLKDKGRGRQVIALLYYLSPWLLRWRGTQLPVEMILGEAGSGKSTLLELRLDILTGIPKLRNAPQDLKDWTASITNAGGLHVTDNLQLGDKNMRQKISDELCRLVTEPNPTVEMRKYYTNAQLMELPVRCTFAITAIQQPFTAADILQRGILVELDKGAELASGDISYDSSWRYQQIQRYGGREAWIAHHLLVLHRFFQLAQKKWDRHYKAKHRLINLEQAMVLMAEVFGLDSKWIPDFVSTMTDRALSDSDWTFEGVQAFCDKVKVHGLFDKAIYAQDIVEWAKGQEDFKQCELLINARRLGRYLKTHKTSVAQICGLVENGTSNNRVRYKVLKPKAAAVRTPNPPQPQG